MRRSAFRGIPTTGGVRGLTFRTFNGVWASLSDWTGSIQLAHTAEERIPKNNCWISVEIYARMTRQRFGEGAANG